MPNEDVIGVFIGLESSNLEYIADIIAPYNSDFTISIGDILLVSGIDEFIVARIIEYRPIGELTSFMGQKWLSDVAYDLDSIGQDIKERKIRYSVKIKILGSLKDSTFIPGLAKIPHITSKVLKPSKEQLKSIISGANKEEEMGFEIGSYYLDNSIRIKFDVSQLHTQRTFIFARAGFGKSNLMKLIALNWPKRSGGLLIFDPEGEYATTDAKGRPGIMDGREAILITNRPYDQNKLKNVYRNLKLNLGDLPPQLVVPIIVHKSKHETIFFAKLMGLDQGQWKDLVDLLSKNEWNTDLEEIMKIILKQDDEEEINFSNSDSKEYKPILNNLVEPIRKMHDPESRLLDIIIEALKRDEVVILDISLLDNNTALKLSSLIVRYIFNENQRMFTEINSKLITATFVIEEAQSVLDESSGISAFIELAKEGRKYSLGGIFITQQPGSISHEILSQSNNYFVFHLLSKEDLDNLRRANYNYSNDILTQILSEPIEGKCYMSLGKQPFVIPVKIDHFAEKVTKNNAERIQSRSNPSLLEEIINEIYQKSDSILQSIRNKKLEIEKKFSTSDLPEKDALRKKTVLLFQSLNEDEKNYLREKGYIQKNDDGKEFAVKFNFYKKL